MTVVSGTVPMVSGRFLGRERDLAGVGGLFRDTPVVTLVGAPGIGKTRLALAYATARPETYPGGVRFADLSRLTDPVRVADSVAAAPGLGGHLDGADPGGSHLLVLDTCEHLIDACADLVSTLVNERPGLRILATSREPLSVQGEAAYRVPALRSGDAVQVFLDRAAARDRRIPDDMTPAVAEICRGLDHIPLAVELAATRTTVLSPTQLAARLDDCLALLTEGSRTAPARHRSLRAALDWSHILLREPERVLLRRLSVFADEFRLDDAEQVCAAGPVPREHVFGLLARLVATSLVECDPSGPDARYRLLSTVRRYAAAHLTDAGEQAATRLAHARWCLALLGTRAGAVPGYAADFTAALDWCAAHGMAPLRLDLAAAMSRFWLASGQLEHGRSHLERLTTTTGRDRDPAAGDGAPWARAMSGLGLLRCALGEYDAAVAAGERALAEFETLGDEHGRQAATALLTGVRALVDPAEAVRRIPDEPAPPPAGNGPAGDRSALALAVRAMAHAAAGDLAAARATAERCLDLAPQRGDRQGRQFGLLALGHVAVLGCRYRTAEPVLAEALAIAQDRSDPLGTALALAARGEAAAGQGQFTRADELLAAAVATARRIGSPALLGHCLGTRGWARLAADEPDAAHRHFTEAVALGDRATPRYLALNMLGLCEVALTTERADAADVLADESLAVARRGGDRVLSARSLSVVGRLAHRAGDPVRAWRAQHEALATWADLGLPGQAAQSLQACAGLELDRQRYDVAARLLGAAEAIRASTDLVPGPRAAAEYAGQVAELSRQLPAGALAAARREGAGLSLSQAVSYVGRHRGPRGRAAGWSGLTRAEREIASLAADGLTNREIGEVLFISPRTVQTHLSNVFAKLGVGSRKHLAREVAQRGQHLARYLGGLS